MANEFIYSPNSRLTKFRHHLPTEFYARGGKWNSNPYLCVKSAIGADVDIGYLYYDNDLNTSAGFIFATQYDFSSQVQNFKQVCFSSYTRLFRIKTQYTWTYYRVDATGLLHGNNTGRTEEEVSGK